jgi:two-component system cell cycle sensor histidine kinase/response regulator CckA
MMEVAGATGDRRLLLVEDDPELRSSLSEMLRDEGYDVIDASNGSEALDRLKQPPAPDLILLDLMMPVKDGWQFRLEQRQDPAIASIPVLAMSADDTPKAAAIDADLYLKKPFEGSTLLEAIRRIIETKRLAHLDRMASLGTLAAGIAHEINNPLTYVIANLQLLEEEMPRVFHGFLQAGQKVPSGQKPDLSGNINRLSELGARLRDALDGAERIRGIVLHVKTFSRADDEHKMPIDVRSILDSSIKVVFSEIRQRARLVKDYRHTPLVFANPGQLGQVFLNLLLNAAHAITDHDPHRNTIRVTTDTSPSGDVVVEFSDTGSGIPADIRHRIFDPFFTTKPLGVGTGLGLSICHGIVLSLRGTITIESDIGKGSTFRVTLPMSPEPVRPTNRWTPVPTSQRRGRVLIIDDEPRIADAVKCMLASDHDATVATSGGEAISLLMRDPSDEAFDLILCDLHMPEMTGMDLHQELLQSRPGLANRMVFMTGGTFTAKSRDFVSRVSNPVVDKPIDITALRALVASRVLRKQA